MKDLCKCKNLIPLETIGKADTLKFRSLENKSEKT